MQRYFQIIILSLLMTLCYATSNNLELFPISRYSQNVDLWFNPHDSEYNDNLLNYSYQQKRLFELKHNYFGTDKNDNSPWSSRYIQFILNEQVHEHIIANTISDTLDDFDNNQQPEELIKFGMNYRPYSSKWIKNIKSNINLTVFNDLKYLATNRAIASNNLLLRALPTFNPAYNNYKIAGEGYPFDNLQVSAIYAGTPLYILGTTINKEWLLVLAPEYIGWVHAGDVARVDDNFIKQWQSAAYTNLAGIKQSAISIIDQYGEYRFNGYVGMMFPVSQITNNGIQILIPVKQVNGMATISYSNLATSKAAILPLRASIANFAELFKTLQGRNYGWGNLGFYNDCSAEMKAIFTLFGFFMPRSTSNQIFAGKMVDISSLDAKARADYLIKNGVPLLTLVRIKGHILLYVGSYKEADGNEFALSYQQMWGMSPKDRNIRFVIGQSVFLPLLSTYPENKELASELDSKIFQLIYLDQFPDKPLNLNLYKLLGLSHEF